MWTVELLFVRILHITRIDLLFFVEECRTILGYCKGVLSFLGPTNFHLSFLSFPCTFTFVAQVLISISQKELQSSMLLISHLCK